jgi:riboflavin kinase/FMN adenylyltransferase
MRIFAHTDTLPDDARGAVVAIGNFDGLHRGHQRVIEETLAIATRLGVPAAVMTFEPHPRRLFAPDAPPFRLTSLASKARRLEGFGLDYLVACRFDAAFAGIPAEAFLDDILIDRLGVRHVVVGRDFRFGHKRAGDVDMLKVRGQAAGIGLTLAPEVKAEDGTMISSNTIRSLLVAGDPLGAARLLGRPWEVEGEVMHGDARGRDLGFPTANVNMGDYLHPANGVYAVRACIEDGGAPQWIDGAASFGLRPQFAGTDPRLEVFLLDYRGDLYGRTLRVAFHDFLRGEQVFTDVEGLIAQMHRDVAQTREILAKTA